MEFSESSDNEFWREIDIVRSKQNTHTSNKNQSPLSSKIVDVIKSKITAEPKAKDHQSHKGVKDYYEEKITRIRESKDEEIKQLSILTKNHLKREYETLFATTKQKYKSDLADIIKECINLKETLHTKDIIITQLCKTISDMELSLVSNRIKLSKSDPYIRPKSNDLDEGFYLEQIYNLSTEVNLLKETCALYLKEIDKAKAQGKVSIENYKKTEANLKIEIERLNNLLKQKDQEIEQRARLFQIEFEKFKNEMNLESQARDVVVYRQKGHIDGLRDELKNAKIVLQNRNLRTRFYEKLDDYMKDSETNGHKKTQSEAPTRNASVKFKTPGSSKCAKKRTRRSEASSPHAPIFIRKISSPNSFTLDINL